MKRIREELTSNKLSHRIITTLLLFSIIFLGVTIISYFLLPEGLLKTKNNVSNFEMSTDILLGSLQIFLWNLVSVVAIVIGSIFSKAKGEQQNGVSIGYNVFFILILLNALTLGTWSFTAVNSNSPGLVERLIGSLDIFHRGGLWEMIGQLFITCSIAHISLVCMKQGQTKVKKIKEIKLNLNEKIFILIGILLIYIGALIETISISLA